MLLAVITIPQGFKLIIGQHKFRLRDGSAHGCNGEYAPHPYAAAYKVLLEFVQVIEVASVYAGYDIPRKGRMLIKPVQGANS